MRPALFAAVAAAALIATMPAASAAMDQAKITAARQAAAEFVKLARNSAKTGQPPRETDPRVKALLDTVFDTSAMTTIEFSDLPRITQWLANADKVGLVYMLAGTGTNNLAAAANPKIADRINKNLAAFESEYGRFVDFQVALSGFTLDAIRAKMESASEKERKHPKFQAGFVQAGSGIAQTIAGTLSTFVTEGITDDWRRARLEPLNAISPKVAATLPKEMREKMNEMAREVSDQMSDAQIKDSVRAIGETFVK